MSQSHFKKSNSPLFHLVVIAPLTDKKTGGKFIANSGVERYNTENKVIGASLAGAIDLGDPLLIPGGRISFDLVINTI